jgi:PTS system mannitol-specific IIC component
MAAKGGVAKFGKFLSGMVMPNIGVFIAWGFLCAMFIPTGWIPNANLAWIATWMITILIPVLIAAQGGHMVAGDRGRVIGAIAIMGCIAEGITLSVVDGAVSMSTTTMLMAAMAVGPFAGWVIKKWDAAVQPHVRAGFEMLVDNFSLGIIGLVLAILGYLFIGPFMAAILAVLTAGAQAITNAGLLPLLAVVIEPAKVLFLNNAINHGIFEPIALQQAADAGKSIFFMLEPNPGPGLGVLLAYAFFCKDAKTKQSAPGAIIIHFLGGIHEIYFPYVLMNPKVIIAPIVGNAVAILWFSITGCGLIAPASPGSIIAFLAMAAPGTLILTIIGVALAAGISFVIAAPIVRRSEIVSDESEADLLGASDVRTTFGDKIVFACDAGMGSSAMGATRFRNRIKLDRPDVIVEHASVDSVPADASIVVVQRVLAERAAKSAPNAQQVIIDNFLADPGLDALFAALTANTAEAVVPAEKAAAIEEAASPDASAHGIAVRREGIKVGCKSVTREQAIRAAGELLVKQGCVDEGYVDAMVERDKLQSVYMGMGVAIPHGTNEAKDHVKKTGVVLLQYPGGVEWGEEKAHLVFGIAGVGDEHLSVLANICKVLDDEEVLKKMNETTDVDWLLKTLN